MKKHLINFMVFMGSVLFFFLISTPVEAGYSEVCVNGEILAQDSTYKKCGRNIIYLYEEDKKHSSYIISNKEYGSKDQILYAGVVDGLDTFYASRFDFYSVVYDDRGLFTSSENMWADIAINGETVYDGAFKDNTLIDNSFEGFLTMYNEVGTYIVRQYISQKVVKAIRIIVVSPKDYDLYVAEASLGEESLLSSEVSESTGDLFFAITGGKYGFAEDVIVNVNTCEIKMKFDKNLVVPYSYFDGCLVKNDHNEVDVTIANGLNQQITINFDFKLVGNSVSIKLENSISSVATTSSRRVVITPSAGKGNTLNEEYNLYYWSTSKNDGLTYEDFMTNYEKSSNKGSYTSSKGVILRNEEGTYYLYALAKDDTSVTVVRSDEYVLTKNKRVNRVMEQDIVFVCILIGIAALPVVVYLFIRGKDTL